jgi:capsular exopolysaccharide synthesis family protein
LVPEQPLIRRQYTNLARGIILGIVLAAITAWLLETLDKTVKSPQTARQLFDYPLLGTIPNFQGSHLIVRDNSNAFVSEAFRMLQTNLRFLNVDRQCKVIVISSSVGKEGKSVVASNLAIAVAQLGRQVLLIDGDLRQPTQHLIWELPNNIGLSSVLTGQVEFNEAVTEVLPNLQLLASGETSNTPIALIDSSQMAVLIANSAQNYDFVIVDSPPLTASADAMLLGKMTDGIMLVVRPEVADFNSINTSKDLLEQSHQTVLGIVINGIRIKKQPS